ncbi:MAG: Suppressor of fused protein (SUFU), partial [Hydrogeniiclostridium mannosilyticum]
MEDRDLYKKAISVLQPHEEYFAKDHNWNFRMAFAYYYLDQEGPALHYFQQALKARPGDEDTQRFIDDCRERLLLPRFKKNFRERTAEAWAAFQAEEAELRKLLDCKDRDGASAELVAKCSGILSLGLENPAFELGFNGKKYELILTPEGNRVKLFELVYFRQQAPPKCWSGGISW